MTHFKNPTIIGFIFARGGSKGVLGKNIRNLAGKPLIAYAIEAALQSKYIRKVIVSTDCEKIKEISVKFGADVPFLRPAELAQDHSPEWTAWQHAIRFVNDKESLRDFDVFVSIPCTSPLRTAIDLDNCISAYLEGGTDIVVTVKNAARHPSFNMVTLDHNKQANLVMPPNISINRRQDANQLYDMTTVAYVASPEFIINNSAIFDGTVKAVVIPEDRAIDIDTPLDFKIAEFLMNERKKISDEIH